MCETPVRKTGKDAGAEVGRSGCPSSMRFPVGALGACEGSDFGLFFGSVNGH